MSSKLYTTWADGTIAGVVSAVPAGAIENSSICGADEAAKLTGVLSRRHAYAGFKAYELSRAAASQLMAKLDWAPSSVRLLVYVTQTPEGCVPADVYQIAAELGLGTDVVCVQVNWSCAGYVHGLWATMRLLDSEERGLLLVGDVMSNICDPRDRATAPLFGDAGSATALVGVDYKETTFVFGSDGTGAAKLSQTRDNPLAMNGPSVFNFTIERVPKLVAEVLWPYGGRRPVIQADYLLFHQANKFMLDHLVKKCGLDKLMAPECIPQNLDQFGNTSCASIPLLLCDKLGMAAKGKRAAMFGFGAGWAWGGAILDLSELQVCEVIEV